jgi:large subunit ribosomal protein L2
LALCVNISRDSSRTCFTALIKYSNGTFSYILAPQNLKNGFYVFTSDKPSRFFRKYTSGCNVLLRFLNYQTLFFNVELYINEGGKYSRAAGTFCKIMSIDFDKNIAKIKLPTGLNKIISLFCMVTLGRASNYNHRDQFIVKAGYYRLKNIRPTVRGVAMNPVDHPHGGRTKTSSPEVTP